MDAFFAAAGYVLIALFSFWALYRVQRIVHRRSGKPLDFGFLLGGAVVWPMTWAFLVVLTIIHICQHPHQ